MRLLLDTHIWIWSLQDPKRLGRRLLRELHNPENELWLSPISTWEALMLHDKGRVRLHGDPDAWVIRATAPFQEAPLTHEIAAVSRRLNLPQRDPADRFLAATALVLDLVLVTADASLLGLGEIATLGNR
ncbi:MAG: type II toxin-antitoxin system VapC family toxin [Candidatus Sulfotelmatobacter sp.]